VIVALIICLPNLQDTAFTVLPVQAYAVMKDYAILVLAHQYHALAHPARGMMVEHATLLFHFLIALVHVTAILLDVLALQVV